jgi:hypothetical protein
MADPIEIMGDRRSSIISSQNFEWSNEINDLGSILADRGKLQVNTDLRPAAISLPEMSFLEQESSDPVRRYSNSFGYNMDPEQRRRDQRIDFIDTDPRLYSQTLSSGPHSGGTEGGFDTESIHVTNDA